MPIAAPAYVYALSIYMHRVRADEGSIVSGKTFVDTIDDASGAILGRSFSWIVLNICFEEDKID